ncbi:MAG: hypothetical protein ACRENJ_07145 [Candidatus Eiseniibacteriota bacterium]
MTMWRAEALPCRRRSAPAAALAGTLALLAGIAPATAGPVTAVGGFDHYAIAGGSTTDGILGAVVFGAAGGDLTLAAVRFDDSDAGQGFSYTGGLGLPVAPMMRLRVTGTRFVGEQELRAWRVKVGPEFSLPGGRAMTVSYAHYRNHLGARSNAGIAEAATPLVPRLSGRATASFASAPQGSPVFQGSVGLGWTVAPHVELSGEGGVVNAEAGAAAPGSPGGGLLGGLPAVGGGGTGGTSGGARSTHGTLSLGVRVTLP